MSSKRSEGNQGYLPRGGACVSCRRRKMKCDGQHPICGQCDRAGRAEDCEYLVGQERSKVQILEDNISRLEARIQELQNPVVSAAAVSLHPPYVPPGSNSGPRNNLQEPPRHVAEKILANFFHYSSEFGFFLSVRRIHRAMVDPSPPGHPNRPAPALIFAIYLWAIHISTDPAIKSNEGSYLTRAIQEAATGLSVDHPAKIMHSIQAEVLLSSYFFANGRFFEGKYHVANAVSTALSAGLHKIRSANGGSRSSTPPPLAPPRDATEEGERIIGAWTVFTLDKAWAVALEHAPNFEHSDNPMSTKVDTPWPLEMEQFEQGQLPPNVRTSHTIINFLNSVATPDLGLSSRAVEAKAAVLMERVTKFISTSSANTNPSQVFQEFSALDGLIDQLKASIPPPNSLSQVQNPEQARRLALGYTLLSDVTLRLHAPFVQSSETSRRKRLSAAQMILDIVISLRKRQLVHINPLIGTAWVDAAQVMYEEISNIRAMRSSGTWSGNSPPPDEQPILNTVKRALDVMAEFAAEMPLMSASFPPLSILCDSITDSSLLLSAFQITEIRKTYRYL
ncbi:hypothetical protein CVT24_009931 [Panaeolus cyanescens]|uniref:Zn(2)-C6 fungal-type domain-containing protein n=1 Tax=Panaeolus cyanescens TaxID=181874 RepID=A0A409W457_9AGAR|nr:hypothetical protein CVT24_009931 [Panaeolus cyanescens]